MGKIYMMVHTFNDKRLEPEGFRERIKRAYSFHFSFSGATEVSHNQKIIEVPLPDSLILSLKPGTGSRGFIGRAAMFVSCSPRTLLFDQFFPTDSAELGKRMGIKPEIRGKGAGTIFLLAMLEYLKNQHQGFIVKFSPHASPPMEKFLRKLTLPKRGGILIEDLHAKVKRYHENPKLRDIMGRKARRETAQ